MTITKITVRTIAEDAEFRERVYLLSRGIPYKDAMEMPYRKALAMVIVLGELDGFKLDWETETWKRAWPEGVTRG